VKQHKGRSKTITKETFDTCKLLLGRGLSQKTVAEAMQFGHATVSRINAHSDYQGYRAYMNEMREKYRKPKESVEQDLDKVIDDFKKADIDASIAQFNAGYELHRVANALERLAFAWENPTKKGLFGK